LQSTQVGPFFGVCKDKFWLEAPNISSFLGTGGKRRVIDPALLGAPVSHRGNLVTHANAVRFGETAKLCVGPFGAGKINARGWGLKQ
jgi:hypothetical protein